MKLIVPLLIVALLAYGAYAVFSERRGIPSATPAGATYRSDVYDIEFHYPYGYLLSEQDEQNAPREHHTIRLINANEAMPPENGEGPTAITVDIYQNDQTLVDWMLESSTSNFALGDGTYASTTVAAVEAVRYRWSGLYEGETTAFLHGENVVVVSVTYLNPDDQIRADYAALLASLTLQ